MEDFSKEITSCIEVLSKGGLILYPTEVGWAMGCDATNQLAVSRLLALSQLPENSTILCLMGNDAMLEHHVAQVPEVAWDIIDLASKPTGIIFDLPTGLARNLIDGPYSPAIHIAKDKFCRYLISRFKKPLLCIPAHLPGDPPPSTFSEIAEGVLKAMGYVVNLQRDQRRVVPPSIIAMGNNGTVKVIRE